MDQKNIPMTELPDTLAGVPGIGVVRRRLLAAAGITTRAALAQASPEQLVSLTGMPRIVAEKILASLPKAVEEESGSEPGSDAPIPAFPLAPLGDDTPQTTRLERAALNAQTALADASRHVPPGSKLGETLLRFARLADELPRRVTPDTSRGITKRITGRLQTITERLEALATAKKSEPLSEKRAKRLRQRLKRTRDSIKRTLKSTADTVSHKLSAPIAPTIV